MKEKNKSILVRYRLQGHMVNIAVSAITKFAPAQPHTAAERMRAILHPWNEQISRDVAKIERKGKKEK